MTWLVRHSFAPEDSARVQSGPVLTGTPASAGSYTGPVRVIHEEAEFGQLRPGDVLVCPTTSPVWSILFASVGALVTDGGGLLSHPAIIAREHGIPAVVGTGNATSVLRTGVRVTVDGSGGAVRVMAPNPLA
jgi:pyruvate,water dikinase